MYRLSRNIIAPLARCLAGGLPLAALAFAGATAAAQEQQQPAAAKPQGEGQQLMQQIMAKRAEIQELNGELRTIQEETLESNPGIAKQRDDFVSLMDTKMADAGHDPEASRDRIEALQGRLEGGELPDSEREAVGEELRREVTRLQQAQQQVMQGEELRSKRQTLNEDLMAAMAAHDPETEQLIANLQSAQQEYRELVSEARQERGAPSRPPGS